MPDAMIQNPIGAFGAPVLTGFDASTGTDVRPMKAAVTTFKAGDLVALSSSVGYVIRALTNTAANLVIGVATETVSAVGNSMNVAIGGYVLVNKGTAAITQGNFVTLDTTTTGACANVAATAAVTQATNIAGWFGICANNATAGDTTVGVWLGACVG